LIALKPRNRYFGRHFEAAVVDPEQRYATARLIRVMGEAAS
jgi:hypothetical protein